MLRDQFQRPLRDLRISVTDRCNFRCGYCMPGDRVYHFLPRRELLTFEELTDVARAFADLGVNKLRLTGGEPLLRQELPKLIEMLAGVPGIEDIALTTNGFLLESQAADLRRAGLGRVTVSLDSLDPGRFAALSGRPNAHPKTVLAGIEAAAAAGLPIKVNTVVQRGVNDDEIPTLLAFCRERGFILRFIEFMDVGTLNGWDMTRVVPAAEIVDRVRQTFCCEPIEPNYPGETARRYRFEDGDEFGVIASVTQPFCGGCTRARLSAEGELFTCLFASRGVDLKTLLREHGPTAVREEAARIWRGRDDRYSEMRGHADGAQAGEKVEMHHIGG